MDIQGSPIAVLPADHRSRQMIQWSSYTGRGRSPTVPIFHWLHYIQEITGWQHIQLAPGNKTRV